MYWRKKRMSEKTKKDKKEYQKEVKKQVSELLHNEKVEEFSIKFYDIEEETGDPYILRFSMTKEFI